ncbi:cis-prenyltransferase [Lobosporangium transversale]|uniref:Alkyl transferase n=1 Tax=Lobosporangium transversale TaxID=64571 RepID=A0A1Y2GLV2_9FUNG|nr:putative undecaprenyl diphosphate synthase-domain-containing protein [Lobosporangium transversale]KAF9919030.1 cis-prenyltransferase [Lobosporangium transversale]ORZ14821.1 putative undecaprenyl diphosphate synthase-domain-containing protein [Lobosporangium transversale]|eukprot:XP_021880953.1 putative undecaprenyl diphosphate synthase-domain-containing protein [Lobosporangium transversale]
MSRIFLRTLAIKAMQQGAIPQHVGFIMDGNRRYGKKVNVGNKGYYLGYDALAETLAVCMELGVKVVTVYAFSIENFKRPREQVELLMELAKDKLTELAENSELVRQYGVSVRVLGDVSLLPEDVRAAVHRAVDSTKHNNRAVLNMCFPYTSREELTMASRSLVSGVEAHELDPSDVTTSTLESSLYTRSCPPMDLLIRTSGEIRLSDFMLWQSSRACHIEFTDCYWPEFTFWKLLPILLRYQVRAASFVQSRKDYDEREAVAREQDVVDDLAVNEKSISALSPPAQEERIVITWKDCEPKEKKQRVANFLTHRGHLPNCPLIQLQ